MDLYCRPWARNLQVYKRVYKASFVAIFQEFSQVFVFLTIEYQCLVEHSKGLTTHWSRHKLNWRIRPIKNKLLLNPAKHNATNNIDDENFHCKNVGKDSSKNTGS